MAHDHDHGAAHAGTAGTAFALGLGINLAFVVAELVFGVMSHSMALLADAGHNFGDVLGLGLAGSAAYMATRKPSARRTYGYRRTTILASLANALVLVLVTGGIVWESVLRLLHPSTVDEKIVVIVAVAGIFVNGGSALLFLRDRKSDLNVGSAFAHLAADAALALGVAVAGIVVMYTRWLWLDPAVSIALSIFILVSTFGLLRGSLDLALDAVPAHVDPEVVRNYLSACPCVVSVHDLHIWAMSTTETALTAHIVTESGSCEPKILREMCHHLEHEFGIGHSTIQAEPQGPADGCRQAPDDAV
ncbi:MAG: cation diffusion facilitator family transporter [Polyangia bacterium]